MTPQSKPMSECKKRNPVIMTTREIIADKNKLPVDISDVKWVGHNEYVAALIDLQKQIADYEKAMNESIEYSRERCDCGAKGKQENKENYFCDSCEDSYHFQDVLTKYRSKENG